MSCKNQLYCRPATSEYSSKDPFRRAKRLIFNASKHNMLPMAVAGIVSGLMDDDKGDA